MLLSSPHEAAPTQNHLSLSSYLAWMLAQGSRSSQPNQEIANPPRILGVNALLTLSLVRKTGEFHKEIWIFLFFNGGLT